MYPTWSIVFTVVKYNSVRAMDESIHWISDGDKSMASSVSNVNEGGREGQLMATLEESWNAVVGWKDIPRRFTVTGCSYWLMMRRSILRVETGAAAPRGWE